MQSENHVQNNQSNDVNLNVDQSPVSQNNSDNSVNLDDNQKEKLSSEIDSDDPTKNMTKAEKKVFELSQKLHEAKQALEQEKENEKQKNQQEIVKLLTKKNLDSIPLSKWKEHLKEIEKLLNS